MSDFGTLLYTFDQFAPFVHADLVDLVSHDLFMLLPAGILCGCIAWGVSYLVFGLFRMLKAGGGL